MPLDQESINKFKQIYLKKYGIKLTNSEATEQANKLFNLMHAIFQPQKKQYKDLRVNFSFKEI
jgi:hypothetical protein